MTDTTTADSNLTPPLPSDPRIQALVAVFGEDFAHNFRDPVLFITETLRSPAPLSFYRRDFRLLSRFLFLESVYRRRPDYNQELLDNYARMTGQKMIDVSTLLSKRIAQIKALFDTNKIEPDATYLQAQTLQIPVIAAHARSFIMLLAQLDQLYQLTGSASLWGLLDGSQRSKMELEGRKAIRAFTAMVRNEHIKLRKESFRMRAARDGVIEPEIEHAENMVADAQNDFDASSDGPNDLAFVAPEDAQNVLESLVTTGVASSNAAKRTASKVKIEGGASESVPVAPAVSETVA